VSRSSSAVGHRTEGQRFDRTRDGLLEVPAGVIHEHLGEPVLHAVDDGPGDVAGSSFGAVTAAVRSVSA
jgi:hypothetical protein